MRIVRHHDKGLVVVFVERLQKIENLVPRLAIEVARRLVSEEKRRIADDAAGDADALLLTARQSSRVMGLPMR